MGQKNTGSKRIKTNTELIATITFQTQRYMIKYLLKKALPLPMLLLLCLTMAAQQKRITGTVTDTEGKPIAGASIGIKGANNGKSTDSSGNFEMVVPSNQSVLKITSIGYGYQEMIIGAKTTINI